jgi:hypothetical protein
LAGARIFFSLPPTKLVRVIKMCLTGIYSKVHIGKNMSDAFPIQNGLRQGHALLTLLFNLALEYAKGRIGIK